MIMVDCIRKVRIIRENARGGDVLNNKKKQNYIKMEDSLEIFTSSKHNWTALIKLFLLVH